MSKPLPEKCIGILSDEIIRKNFLTKTGKINSGMIVRCLNGREPNARKYIENRYDDSKLFFESLYRIIHGIETHPVCQICGKDVEYKRGKFWPTCSPSCAQKYSPNNLWKTKEGQMKCEESRKQTFMEKYGVVNPGQIPEVRKKVINTVREKYGVDNVFQRKDIIDSFKERSEEIKKKRYETHKKNQSFKSSKIELETFEKLKTKYTDIKYQYKDDRYPYMCDFYIPSLDLFIELNYHWTHGGHPYDENNINDNKLVEEWKSKNTKYYTNALNTWTNLDIKKLNIFKQNNLNYLIFYNPENFNEWFEKQ